jgi:hypothetical protein
MLGSESSAPVGRSMIIRAVVVFPTTLEPNGRRIALCRTRKVTPLAAVAESYDVVKLSSLVASMFVVHGLY